MSSFKHSRKLVIIIFNLIFDIIFLVFMLMGESTIERICYRSTDPQTGVRYHQFYDPPPSTQIAMRLIQKHEDQEDYVKNQIEDYNHQLPGMLEAAHDIHPLRINADQDAFTVFELAESKIVNPLPSGFAAEGEEEDD